MKKQMFLPITAALLIILLSAGGVFAQKSKMDTLGTVEISGNSFVTPKISKAFKRDFKDAVNPKWYQLDKNYLVKFITKDQKNHALYNKNGYLIYHITYGYENDLPDDIKDQFKTLYPEGKITRVFRVEQNLRDIWIVNVDLGRHWAITRVEDNELEEVERYPNGAL